MSSYQITGIAGQRDNPILKSFELPDLGNFSYKLKLKSLAGAKGIHLSVHKDSDPSQSIFRINIPTTHQEILNLQLHFNNEQQQVQLDLPGRDYQILPLDSQYEAPSPKRLPLLNQLMDIVILIDGTCQTFSEQGTRPLLKDYDTWETTAKPLVSLIEWFEKNTESLHSSILAFGDYPLDIIKSNQLQPQYSLYPSDTSSRALQMMTTLQAKERLQNLPDTPGGDFVDALADALLTIGQLHWREDARKLVIILGDSPGFSLLKPIPEGGNAAIREWDIETAQHKLVNKGIELATIYVEQGNYNEQSLQGQLQQAARQQYQSIATYPSIGFTQNTFNPKFLLEQLNQLSGSYLGIDMSWPEVISIEKL